MQLARLGKQDTRGRRVQRALPAQEPTATLDTRVKRATLDALEVLALDRSVTLDPRAQRVTMVMSE